MSDVLSPLDDLLPDLERLYADLHAPPELSHQETRTSGIAAERLRAAGFEVTTGIGGAGVVGLLRNGAGPTVKLRADMDALPVEEDTGLPYSSRATAPDREGKVVPASGAPRRLGELPVNHNPRFAPVLHPTLRAGVEAAVAAALAWLSP